MMVPTPFPELNQVLSDLVSRIQNILGANLIGVYLQGSFAIGDCDQHSDVDFIVVIDEQLTSPQVDALQVMHDQVYFERPFKEWQAALVSRPRRSRPG
jgi:predicted nucleotidyltransferase